MTNTEVARQDFGPIEEVWRSGLPRGGRGLLPLLVILEATTALELEREQAAVEAQDVLSQADEALVMG